MPKLASTRSAYKMLTCIYLCRTLLFFAPYADFFRKNFAEDENRDESLFYRHIFIHSFRVEHPEFPFFIRIYEACVEVGV